MVCSHRPAWDWSPIRQAGGELEVENGSGKMLKGGEEDREKGQKIKNK